MIVFLVSMVVDEGLWSFNVVAWKSFEYSRGNPCLYWVSSCAHSFVYSYFEMNLVFEATSIVIQVFWTYIRLKCCSYYDNRSHFFRRSFNDRPSNEGIDGPIGRELFEREHDDLIADLKDIPKKACDRRVC